MCNDFVSYLEKIEEKINAALPTENSEFFQQWKSLCFGNLNSAVDNSHLKPLTDPAKDLIGLGGKRWRPLFLVLCAQAITENNTDLSDSEKSEIINRALDLTPLVEFVHTASLIHDDIEDNSTTRRGKDAAYITYGTDVAINAATWLYFNASVSIEKLNCSSQLKNQLFSLYTMEVRRLHLGQAMDIRWHRNTTEIPSRQQYSAMVRSKTGTLSSMAAKLGSLAAGKDIAFIEKAGSIASKIGEGFQIIDDYINLSTGNPGKKRGDDIVEGKKSLPVLIFFEKASAEEKNTLLSYFEKAKKEGIDSTAVENAIKLIEKYDCINSAKSYGVDILKESLAEIENLFGNVPSVQLIKQLFTGMIPSAIRF